MYSSPLRAERLRFLTDNLRGLISSSSPDGVVLLHDAVARGQGGAVEGAGEGAEAVAVAGADEEEVLVAGVGRLGDELERRAGGELDRVEAAEADRGRLVRDAVDPDRALAAPGWVVDALDQVPGERAAVGGLADPGRPEPAGLALVVAGRLVVDALCRDLPAPARHLDHALDRDAGALAGPAPAGAAGADGFDRRRLAEGEAGAQAGGVDLQPRPVHPHLAAAGAQGRVGAVAAALAVPHHPEGLAQRTDLGPRRAQHQLLAEEADVAPALARLAVAPQRHRTGGEGQVGPVAPRPAPGDLGRGHAGTVSL